MKPWTYRDEVFCRFFLPNDARRTNLLLATPKEDKLKIGPQIASWAYQRDDGGRGFVFGGLDFRDNLVRDDYRKFLLNGIAWAARTGGPEEGRRVARAGCQRRLAAARPAGQVVHVELVAQPWDCCQVVRGLAGTLVAAAFALSLAVSSSAPSAPSGATTAARPDQSKYAVTPDITKKSVANLAVSWIYPTSDERAYQFNPVIVDGVMYVLAKNSSLVAIDVATRKELWIHANLRGITNRGINYWQSGNGKDRRLLFAMEDLLQAIDARTGKSITTFGTNGRGGSARRARARSRDRAPRDVVDTRVACSKTC